MVKMSKKHVEKLAGEMWDAGVAAIKCKFGITYSPWEGVSDAQRHGWFAATKYAVKRLSSKKP